MRTSIRSDNGPEFIAKSIQQWLADNEIKTIYIDPGCPWQNGFVESFNDKFRRECLNQELIYTISESYVIFYDYRPCTITNGPIALWACSPEPNLPNNTPQVPAPFGLRPLYARTSTTQTTQ